MKNSTNFNGFFRHNRKLEYGLLAIGLALFIAVGTRGLQKIDDMAVAAGDAYKNALVETDLNYVDNLSAQANALASFSLEQSHQTQDGEQKPDTPKSSSPAVAEKKRILDNNNPATRDLPRESAKGQAAKKDMKPAEQVQ